MYPITYLKYFRQRLNMSQDELAERVNAVTGKHYNQTTISLIETKSRGVPDKTLQLIFDILLEEAKASHIDFPIRLKYWHLTDELRLEEVI